MHVRALRWVGVMLGADDGQTGSYSGPEVRLWEVASPVTLAIDSGWVTAYSKVMLFENHVILGTESHESCVRVFIQNARNALP